LEIEPSTAAAHLHLGELALGSGHLDCAAAELEAARRLSPQLTGLYLRLAQIAQQRGQGARALEHLKTELTRADHLAPQRLDIARMLIELGQPRAAIELLDDMIGQVPNAPAEREVLATALLFRGVAHLVLGELAAGIADCRRCVHLAPGQILAMHNLVLAYIEAGRFARAQAFLQRALAAAPGDVELRKLRYRLLTARARHLFARAGRAGRSA
jgi:tetratricopeptide (TPR) repeat protein